MANETNYKTKQKKKREKTSGTSASRIWLVSHVARTNSRHSGEKIERLSALMKSALSGYEFCQMIMFNIIHKVVFFF